MSLPSRPQRSRGAIEFGIQRNWLVNSTTSVSTASLAAGMVIEPGSGIFAFGQASAALQGRNWGALTSVGVNAGTGTVGAAFGPLYRLERVMAAANAGIWQLAQRGELSGTSVATNVTVSHRDIGSLTLSIKRRPGLGSLGTAGITLPMSKRWQTAAWISASEQTWASAAEVRVTWPASWWSSIEAARGFGLSTTTSMREPSQTYVAGWIGLTLR
jgi:hypothetical protein